MPRRRSPVIRSLHKCICPRRHAMCFILNQGPHFSQISLVSTKHPTGPGHHPRQYMTFMSAYVMPD